MTGLGILICKMIKTGHHYTTTSARRENKGQTDFINPFWKFREGN